jgi:hypothetical protein
VGWIGGRAQERNRIVPADLLNPQLCNKHFDPQRKDRRCLRCRASQAGHAFCPEFPARPLPPARRQQPPVRPCKYGYLCGTGGAGAERGAGAGAERTSGAECVGALVVRAPDPRCATPAPLVLDQAAAGLAALIPVCIGVVRTFCVTKPLCSTFCETLARSRTAPRGIPNPAESFRIVNRFNDRPAITGDGPRFTATADPGEAGGCGGLKRCGVFTTVGIVLHATQVVPGCHTHP